MVQLKKFFLESYLSVRWTSDFELFLLYWEVCSDMSLSVVTLGFSVLFLVLELLSYQEVNCSCITLQLQ